MTCATGTDTVSVSQNSGARRLVGASRQRWGTWRPLRTAPDDHGGAPAGTPPDPATEAFLAHRNLLFTVAYEMLGSAADAEDVLQETWLRWAGVDLAVVRDQRAYLVRITTRQALTRLRTLGRRKESYVGTVAARAAADRARRGRGRRAGRQRLDGDAAGAGDAHARPSGRCSCCARCSTSDYDEIAEAVDKTRPRSARSPTGHGHTSRRADRAGSSPPAETRDALEAFQRAVETGDLQRLLDILAPDVVFLGDGGGVKQAVPRPVVGADQVARALAAGLGRIAADSLEPAQVNGYPALIFRLDGEVDTVMAVRIDDGLISGLYAVRNPEKLSHMGRETTLRR